MASGRVLTGDSWSLRDCFSCCLPSTHSPTSKSLSTHHLTSDPKTLTSLSSLDKEEERRSIRSSITEVDNISRGSTGSRRPAGLSVTSRAVQDQASIKQSLESLLVTARGQVSGGEAVDLQTSDHRDEASLRGSVRSHKLSDRDVGDGQEASDGSPVELTVTQGQGQIDTAGDPTDDTIQYEAMEEQPVQTDDSLHVNFYELATDDNALDKSLDKSVDEPGENALDKYLDKSLDKSLDNSADKSGEVTQLQESENVVQQQDDSPMFDISDLQTDPQSSTLSTCGQVHLSFHFLSTKSSLKVTVHETKDVPSEDRGGPKNIQVRLLLLPTKKTRHKTKIKNANKSQFDESFEFKVHTSELSSMAVRVRLYGCERLRRGRMIGETLINFSSLNLSAQTGSQTRSGEELVDTMWAVLEPRSNLCHGDSQTDLDSLTGSDSGSSNLSLQHGGVPELMLGLAYNGSTGRLSVEVIKGSNFKNMAHNRPPDTRVKITLLAPNGQELSHCKTSVRRGQPNPLYKETFIFQVPHFQLPDVSLMSAVFSQKTLKRKDMVGWFTLGQTNSSDEEKAHWREMLESTGEQVCRWHVLLEP